jgi:hypothetical protein
MAPEPDRAVTMHRCFPPRSRQQDDRVVAGITVRGSLAVDQRDRSVRPCVGAGAANDRPDLGDAVPLRRARAEHRVDLAIRKRV